MKKPDAKWWAKIEAKLDALDARVSAIIGRAQQSRKSRATSLIKPDRVPAPAARVVHDLGSVPAAHVVQDGSATHRVPVAKHHRRVEPASIYDDHVINAKLASMLERSCSLRGYDGDEAVGYDR